MTIKGIVDEDFVNYKEPSMFIAFPSCTFKCEKECGVCCCQNSALATQNNINVSMHDLLVRYLKNPITTSIVCGGLEPFDSFKDLEWMISIMRNDFHRDDTFVIYSGYKRDEIEDKINILKQFKNVVVKFGRYIPNRDGRFDSVLGVRLASDNQYAEVIS